MAVQINTDHYKKGRKYEPWDVIADWNLDYFLGNALKYISRAGRKSGNSEAQDLQKAVDYLQKRLSNMANKPAKSLEEAYEQQYKYREEYDPT